MLTETKELNVFTYRNFYNGGGVGVGDFNGDGLPDVVLTSNQGGPKLYLNEGHFRFRDITDAVGANDEEGIVDDGRRRCGREWRWAPRHLHLQGGRRNT